MGYASIKRDAEAARIKELEAQLAESKRREAEARKVAMTACTSGHVTIERTAKRFKKNNLIAFGFAVVAVLCGSIARAIAENDSESKSIMLFAFPAIISMGIAILMFIKTTIQVWWHHG